jgi:DNA-binding CsgD family transcriptional regulator
MRMSGNLTLPDSLQSKSLPLEKAAALWAARVPMVDIAEALGIARSTAWQWKSQAPHLFPPRQNLATPEKIAEAATLWAEGKPAAEIAARFGVCETTVLKWTVKNRALFAPRPAGRRPSSSGLKQRAAALWAQGESHQAICAALFLKSSTLWKWACQHRGLFPKRPRRRIIMDIIEPTPDMLDKASALWGAGKSVRVIGADLGVATSTLMAWTKAHPGLFGARQDRISERLAEAARLWAEGKTSNEIGVLIGINGSRVRQIARENPHLFALRNAAAVKAAGLTAQQAEIAALWAQNIPVGVIAERTGVKAATIHGWAKRMRDHFPRRASFGKIYDGMPKVVWSGAWTDAEVETAAGMIGKFSAAQIGKAIGKSRSAVLGKMHRLQLALPKGRVKGEQKSRNSTAVARRAAKPVVALETVQHQSAASLVKDNFRLSAVDGIAGKSLMELGARDCRWPVNAPDRGVSASGHPLMREGDEPHLFCGAAVLEGKPYCRCHMAYAVTSREKQVADHVKAALARAGMKRSFRTGFRAVSA